jgi:hypothetical protein
LIAREVLDQGLQFEQMGRQLELLDSQLVPQRHRQAVLGVGYLMGQGTQASCGRCGSRLEARRVEMAIAQGRVVAELDQVIGNTNNR